jgi:hypothetical protein
VITVPKTLQNTLAHRGLQKTRKCHKINVALKSNDGEHWSAMPKMIFLACLLSSLALVGQTGDMVHVFPGHIGLVLIAATHDGFAVATDGSQFNADGTSSEVQKLFQVGKYGAIAFAGNVSIQDPVDRPVREEVNISRIAKTWLDSHPDAGLEMANSEINNLVAQTLAKFFSTRNPGAQAGKYAFTIICAGFSDGKALLAGTKYSMPLAQGKAARVEKLPANIKPGTIWGHGSGKVLEELISGKAPVLNEFKAEPSVKKFHSSAAQDLSPQDFINLFDTILRAADSEPGKKVDRSSPIIAPPNRLAMVFQKDGFVWKK